MFHIQYDMVMRLSREWRIYVYASWITCRLPSNNNHMFNLFFIANFSFIFFVAESKCNYIWTKSGSVIISSLKINLFKDFSCLFGAKLSDHFLILIPDAQNLKESQSLGEVYIIWFYISQFTDIAWEQLSGLALSILFLF